jgi:uncharacterized surface protein with fasciclin (FAS1) repeats
MKRIAIFLGAAALMLAVVPSTFAASKPTQSIVEIATANGSFTTLLAAVGCADPAVATALTGKGPLTVFAPTDTAFAKAGLTAENVCTALPKATLTKVLLYHVVPGNLPASKVLPAKWDRLTTLKTALGQPIWALHNGTLFTSSGGVSRILVSAKLFNIAATNGIIHVVDAVLMPRG